LAIKLGRLALLDRRMGDGRLIPLFGLLLLDMLLFAVFCFGCWDKVNGQHTGLVFVNFLLLRRYGCVF
jgi:hypothetical protein